MTKGRELSLNAKAHAALAARYVASLRAYLRVNGGRNGDRAQAVGRTFMAGGLEALDVAIVHEKALVTLGKEFEFGRSNNDSLRHAGIFLHQVLTPMEAVLRTTREAVLRLHERNTTLSRHTDVLARSNRRLEREIVRRLAAEKRNREGEEKYRTLFMESRLMQKKLRRLTHQIISAQEEERKQISRELHDGVVQTLVGINVELSALGKGTAISLEALKQKIAHTQRLVEDSVNAVHRFARELRPAILDDLGLIPALHAYSQSLSARKKIKIEMSVFGGVEALGNAKRTVLFRVAQEALTNIARHAHATQVRMSISESNGAIKMEISDNGRSFQVGKSLDVKSNKRLGLIGMKERVEMVGGHFGIESVLGKGTTVRAEVPIGRRRTQS